MRIVAEGEILKQRHEGEMKQPFRNCAKKITKKDRQNCSLTRVPELGDQITKWHVPAHYGLAILLLLRHCECVLGNWRSRARVSVGSEVRVLARKRSRGLTIWVPGVIQGYN
jgi:hypothetical protein